MGLTCFQLIVRYDSPLGRGGPGRFFRNMTSPGGSKLHQKFNEMRRTPPNPKNEKICSCTVDKPRILVNDK